MKVWSAPELKEGITVEYGRYQATYFDNIATVLRKRIGRGEKRRWILVNGMNEREWIFADLARLSTGKLVVSGTPGKPGLVLKDLP